MGLQIYGNIDAGSLLNGKVQSVNDLTGSGIKNLVAGDGLEVELFLTSQSGLVNIQDYSVRLGMGDLNARPTGGTWDLGSSTNLDYNINETDLGTAIASEASANTTTELSPFVFKTVFSAFGSQTIPTIDSTGLTPNSTVSIVKLVEGDGSTYEQWLIRIFRNPIAFQDTWTNFTKTGVGEGIQGALGLGTAEIYDQFSDTVSSFTTTLEMEITDTDGNVTTVFQVPVTIGGEVLGAGITASSISPSNFVTATDVNTSIDSATTMDNSIYVSQSRGNDSTGTRNSTTKPYATFAGGLADAQSGDTIVLLDGDFSSEGTQTLTLGTLTINIRQNVTCCSLTQNGTVVKCNIYGQQDAQISGALTINGSCIVRGIAVDNVITNGAGTIVFDNCDIRGDTGVDTVSITANNTQPGTIKFKECIIRENGSTNVILINENRATFYITNSQVDSATSPNPTIKVNNSTTSPLGIYFNNAIIDSDGLDLPIGVSTTGGSHDVDVYFLGAMSQFANEVTESNFGTFSGNYYVDSTVPSLPPNLTP